MWLEHGSAFLLAALENGRTFLLEVWEWKHLHGINKLVSKSQMVLSVLSLHQHQAPSGMEH
jgi:hypothetical protein